MEDYTISKYQARKRAHFFPPSNNNMTIFRCSNFCHFCLFQEQAASRSGQKSQVDGVCELLGVAWKVLKMTELITWVPQLLESLCLGCLRCLRCHGCLPWGCLEASFVDRIRELSNANDWILSFSQQNHRKSHFCGHHDGHFLPKNYFPVKAQQP